MNRPALLAMLVLCSLANPAMADIYRWVDSSGHVHFSDSPPPETKNLKQMKGNYQPGDPDVAKMHEAASKAPVTLYTANCGEHCNQAAAFLQNRGIPFSTRQVDKDDEAAKALRQLVGGLQVPVVSIGTTVQKGFDKTLWGNLLDLAGYPKVKVGVADTKVGGSK